VVFNMDRKRDPIGYFFTTLIGSASGPRVSRLAKLSWVKDGSTQRLHFAFALGSGALAKLVGIPGCFMG
jgi:hypothetical protein